MVVWWFVIWAFHLSNTWSHNFLSICLKLQLHCIPTLQNGLRKRRPKHFKDSRIEHVYKKEPNSLPTGVDRRSIGKIFTSKITHARRSESTGQLGGRLETKSPFCSFTRAGQYSWVDREQRKIERNRWRMVSIMVVLGNSLSLSLLTCFHRLFVSSAWM